LAAAMNQGVQTENALPVQWVRLRRIQMLLKRSEMIASNA